MNPTTIPAREPDPYDPMVGIRAPLQVTVSADTRWSVLWVKAMRLAAYVVGPERAIRAAQWGATRLIRVRFGNERWHWLRPEETDE